MALQKLINYKGLEIPACYHEIVAMRLEKDRGAILVFVNRFSDGTKEHLLDSQMYTFPYDDLANVQWAYAQLKTLPEFAGAIDV